MSIKVSKSGSVNGLSAISAFSCNSRIEERYRQLGLKERAPELETEGPLSEKISRAGLLNAPGSSADKRSHKGSIQNERSPVKPIAYELGFVDEFI